MLFFSEAIIPLVSDKRERLLLHIVIALFKSLVCVIYIFTFGTLKVVGLKYLLQA